jgi:hypothetical protein
MSSTSLWSRVKKNFPGSTKITALLSVILFAVALGGCDNPQNTIDTLRKEIAAFKTTPDDKKQLEIEQNLAKLETQVYDLQKKGDVKADDYARELISLRTDYQSAKMAKTLDDAKKALEGFGGALKDGVKSFSDAFHKDTNTNATNQ